jgi:hypothetical protein
MLFINSGPTPSVTSRSHVRPSVRLLVRGVRCEHMGYLKETASCFWDMKFVALVSIVDCVVVVLFLAVKMICSDCGACVALCCVLAQMLSDCVCVHSLIAWWCGGRKSLLLRSKGVSARSVEPGVLFGDFGAV